MGIKEEDNTEFTEVSDQVEIISGSFKGSEELLKVLIFQKSCYCFNKYVGRTTPAELSLSDVKVIK